MRYIVDANTGRRLRRWLEERGYDALYSIDVFDDPEEGDRSIAEYADLHNRVVISRDQDFRDRFDRGAAPRKLIKLDTDNIPQKQLLYLFERNIADFEQSLASADRVIVEVRDLYRWTYR